MMLINRKMIIVITLTILMTAINILSADVITNGTFDTDLNGWMNSVTTGNGSRAWDNTVYGVASGSFRYMTNTGRRQEYRAVDSIYIPTVINQNDPVYLSFYWYKTSTTLASQRNEIVIYATESGTSTRTELWSDLSEPLAGQVLDGNVNALDVSSLFSTTGNYYLVVYGRIISGRDNGANTQFNLDDIILDVQGAANSAPTVTPGATQVSVSPINRLGANTTTISTTFNDTDQPGIGAFNVTFKIREPNNSTELTIVNNQPNGGGGLTITDNGGGSYTASYVYNPDDAQTTGLYDLYFEVTDGTDNAIDDFANNLDELEINEVVANNAPTVVSGATQVSVSPVNRFSTNTTTISTDFNDSDQPGIGAFNVTFKIREPNNSTELTIVNNQPNGGGGLTITDNGGGSYTASYIYNPDDAQTTGLYDLYFEVTDGTDNVIDDYANNLDELEINEILPNNAPTVTPGATQVSVSPVNRYSTNTTTISTDFNDTDQPGIGAFNVTFKIREPNNSTELTLVNNQPTGGGGLTITDNGGGSYTASYIYNPDDAQTTGLYDLYFEVTDGTDNVIDDYNNNLDELEINEILPNNAPTVTPGATFVSASPVNRLGANTTTISTDFNDTDQPGIGAFNVTFKIREPNNSTELTLVNNQPNGGGGLTITDNGGGSYTASYIYNPDNAQTTGLYDLYFEVTDGTDNVIDDYNNNLDELEINEIIANSPPTLSAGVTAPSKTPVARSGTDNTTISATFTDLDDPGLGAFTVTFSVRRPNNSTIDDLALNETNGSGGVTITNNGGGSYTAEYTWDPISSQTLGLYDLYFYVSDGTDNVTDDFANNLDELEVVNQPVNNPPTVVAGATLVSVSPVDRLGANTTTISTDFNDSDQPGIAAFNATFKIREPNNSTELTLVNNQPNGGGGLTIIDNGGGSYTASYIYNPDDAQTLGLYDLYFEVTDGTDNAIDDYNNNLDELQINEVVINNAPTVIAGATQVGTSPINRFGSNTTTISATFEDSDQPGTNAFNVIFKIREPNNSTELFLVNNQSNGNGGLLITDNGGGSYTASYNYNPNDAQTIGLYDLYFEVTDGTDNTIDDFTDNTDELEINEVITNNPPIVSAGATQAGISPINRIGTNSTLISATFSDSDDPGVGAFSVTFKIREPNNTSELTLVNNQTNGSGGLIITDNGGGSYTASYSYNPNDNQVLGLYDLYFEVSDGSDNAIDGYNNNLDELDIIEVVANNSPSIVAGITGVAPTSIDRFGAITTTISATFTDIDEPGITAFYITFKLRSPFNQSVITVVDLSQNGQNGLTIIDNGGGSYTANVDWDPPDDAVLGYYDLYSLVYDGANTAIDEFVSNPDELLLTNGGENSPPIVASDAAFASPGSIERIGAINTTISATFQDADIPGLGAFTVTFKLRYPNNSTEIVLADNLGNGAGGVSITDDGGGIYTANISWDPPDAQTTGLYDLYFHVSDGIDTSYDFFSNNLDELEIYDAISNNTPTIAAGNTFVLPVTVNRIGSEFTMIKSTFADIDAPAAGSFTITIRVRDASSTEYDIVTSAQHNQQGLRVEHLTGNNYEAAVLWDPDVAQTIGLYDLYFEVQDAQLASAIDNYTSNTDELEVVSEAILGDGHLLRRTNDSTTCGGPNSACHNLPEHQDQGCRVCHTPHNTKNIYLVKETITTPISGDKPVIFKTLGIGDPFNDPDPVAGDPTSGVMADSTDEVFTGVCEVCHTSTGHHRNDGTQPPPNHHDAEDCTSCHPHADAFAVSGGGESSGGDGCSCHSAFMTPMQGGTSSYHHNMLSDNADYTVSSKTCLMCHVNHDIFRPDLNTGIGQRAKNLRVDITTSVVQGNSSVLSNTDYQSGGTGGICLSCHTSVQSKSFTPPDGSTQTIALSKSDYDAATSSHNYEASSTFSTDGSTFQGNCVKCHNDAGSKSYQSAGNKFSTHDNPYRKILSPFGTASPSDPLEENVCFACHSTTSNPNAGSNMDFYNVKAMTSAALGIESSFGLTYTHPTTTFSDRHEPGENAAALGDGNRHAECGDCHDVHAAQQGTHDGSSNLVSNALKGTWGVEPTSWPDAPTPTDNGNVFAAPSGYNVVNPAQKEYQICLKCHSNYTTLPTGARNLAEEINPNYPSTHGITIANQNSYCNTTTMFEPWGSSGVAWCSDCHRSDNSSHPEGPHGSNQEHLLVASIVSDDANGTPLCDVCHNPFTYWDGSASASRYSQHPSTKGAHQLPKGCFSCHMWDYAWQSGLGVQTSEVFTDGPVFVHGQNKKWVYKDDDGAAGTGDSCDAFVNGYLADVDFSAQSCWSDEDANDCSHGHNGTGY